MIEPAVALLQRLFPERQVLLRSGEKVRYVALPGWMQGAAVAGALVLLGGVGGLAGAYHNLHKAIHRKEAEISFASDRAAAVAGLSEALAATDRQYALMSHELEDAQVQLDAAASDNEALRAETKTAETRDETLDQTRVALEDRLHRAELALANKSGNVEQLTKQLADSKSALKEAADTRAGLQAKLHELQADSETASGRSDRLKQSLAQREQDLRQIADERERLRSQIDRQGTVAVAATYAGRLEQLIASTGIDLNRMLARVGNPEPAEGGPFVAFDPKRMAEQDKTREATLKSLVQSLPLAAPLDQYTLGSPFGERIDPINHRTAFHSGLDLDAPYRSPVLSTGPGVVTFTGTKDEYGRVVEITHAGGIVTRYAHLHRILVAPGQRVTVHQEIGELGSTGRSTGPHVHYEVLVDGVPLDPAKFMEAGKSVVLTSAH
jgi:murein DD-endopeptidase MepM/ murein hydrolase activator NlpD